MCERVCMAQYEYNDDIINLQIVLVLHFEQQRTCQIAAQL